MGCQKKTQLYSYVKGGASFGITHVRGMCRAVGRCTTEQPRPQALWLYSENLERSQALLIPKPLQPQLAFSAFKPQMLEYHCIMSWNYSNLSSISKHKKPYFFQQFSYHIETEIDVVSLCPSVNKELRAVSLEFYCSDTNRWTKYILNRGNLKTGWEKTSGSDSNSLEFSQRKKKIKKDIVCYCLKLKLWKFQPISLYPDIYLYTVISLHLCSCLYTYLY